MVKLVEISEIHSAIHGPSPPTKHARLSLQQFGIREERVQNLVEEDDGAEYKIEEGEEGDTVAKFLDELGLL